MPTAWNLPPLRDGRPADEQLRARRLTMEQSIINRRELHEERAHVARRTLTIGGVDSHEVGDPHARATLIYLHGGGFSLGHPSMWLRYAARIAEEAQVRVILPRYRLAPESPFPASLHDVVTVFTELAEESPGKPIIVMGESAGASLTASLLAAASATGQRFPDGAIIISPVMDFSIGSTAYDTHASVDPWVSRESIISLRDNYLQGHPYDDPLASPILAEMSSYPPIQLFCGGREALLGDSIEFAGKLALANRLVEAHFIADAEHGWTFVKPSSPQAKTTMAHVVRFIGSIADAPRP